MKQVIVELEEPTHKALKARAAASFRKIPAQLLFEALQYAAQLKSVSAPRDAKKKGGRAA